MSSSDARYATYESQKDTTTLHDVVRLLGDQSHPEHTIFREAGDDDYVKTVTVGELRKSGRLLRRRRLGTLQ